METLETILLLIGQFLAALAFYVFVIEKLTHKKKWYYKALSLLGAIIIYYFIGLFIGGFIEQQMSADEVTYGIIPMILSFLFAGSFIVISMAVFIKFLIDKLKK